MRRISPLKAAIICTLTVAVVVTVAAPASALQVAMCNGAGNLIPTPNGSGGVTFQFAGTARCILGDQEGPYIADFTGSGGAAQACNGALPIARGFDLDVLMVAHSVTSTPDVVEGMRWRLTLTTYPAATPFLVFQDPSGTAPGNQLRGAGAILGSRNACAGLSGVVGVTFDLAWVRRLL